MEPLAPLLGDHPEGTALRASIKVCDRPARVFFHKKASKMGTTSTRIPCLLILLMLGLGCHGSGASDPGKRQLPSAMVVGAVYCDTCFPQEFSKTSHFISGAVVAVECGAAAARPGFRQEARTNEQGVFRVRLPPWIGKHFKSIQACSVKLVSSGEPFCAVAASATSSSLSLRSRKRGGLHVFSAGFFTFKPLQQPELCYQKPSTARSPQLGSTKTFGPFAWLHLPTLPPLPQLPLLPPLPSLPLSPSLPNSAQPSQPKPEAPPTPSPAVPARDQKQDQPAFFLPSPPAPFFAVGIPSFQSPPSVLPPVPFQPPSPSFSIPLPRPTPPPSPFLGFQFPPFPFPPSPFFLGVPPATPSTGAAAAP